MTALFLKYNAIFHVSKSRLYILKVSGEIFQDEWHDIWNLLVNIHLQKESAPSAKKFIFSLEACLKNVSLNRKINLQCMSSG